MPGILAALVFSHAEGEGLFPSHVCSMDSHAVVGLHLASTSGTSPGRFRQRCSEAGKGFICGKNVIFIIYGMLCVQNK